MTLCLSHPVSWKTWLAQLPSGWWLTGHRPLIPLHGMPSSTTQLGASETHQGAPPWLPSVCTHGRAPQPYSLQQLTPPPRSSWLALELQRTPCTCHVLLSPGLQTEEGDLCGFISPSE